MSKVIPGTEPDASLRVHETTISIDMVVGIL